MKAALLALDQLSALAWQQSLYEGDTALLPQDKLKASALNELQSSLSMPDPMATDPRPLLASAVDEVCFKWTMKNWPDCTRGLIDNASSMAESCRLHAAIILPLTS